LFFGRPLPEQSNFPDADGDLPESKIDKFPDVQAELIRDYQKHWSESIDAVHISDFPIYGTRLATIHTRMTDWRPLKVRHAFFVRPYRDTLPFYVFWFGIFIGVVGIVGLAMNITVYRQNKNTAGHA
jgi:hypothetical protein